MNVNNNKEIGDLKDQEINSLKKELQEKNNKLEENKVRIGDFVKKNINLKREKEKLEKEKEELEKVKEKLEKEKNELEKNIKEIKVAIRNEFSNVLKVKYEEKLKEEIQKFKDEFQKQFNFGDLELKIKQYAYNFQQKYKKIIEEKTNSICKTIHVGVKCGKCLKEPIVGYRYKCYICNNFNLCENCEKENQISLEHKHDFIKIRNSENMIYNNAQNNYIIKSQNLPQNKLLGNNININNTTQNKNINSINKNINYNLIVKNSNLNNNYQEEINLGKKYSFECININNLTASIFEEDDSAYISINLLNNGKVAWPEGITKLIFVDPSTFTTNDIILKPQKPGENIAYKINFNNLRTYPSGIYYSFLRFNINGVNLGQQLKLTTSIKEK